MKTAVYPGSFDPITKGHLNIIKRASKVCDKLIVAVLVNPEKKGLFSVDERVEMIKRVTKNHRNVEVQCFSGLLIDFMKEKKSKVIIKGLRTMSDFEYEFKMTNAKYSYLSSSSVKQVAMFGGCIKDLVPDEIIPDIKKKINHKKECI